MLTWGYTLRRLVQIVPTLVFILLVTFIIVRLLPGDPASAMIGDRATTADVDRINAEYGLDLPLPAQFLVFVRNVARGDLGYSFTLKLPVATLVAERLPVTFTLTAMAGLLAIAIAVPLAFVSALNQDRALDVAIRSVFQVGLSMPVFYVGLVLLTIFAAGLRWFPVGGYGDTLGERIYHLALPAVTLAISLSAVLMRNLRTAIIGVVGAEYVAFARSKGLAARVVLARHVLRNALISTVTLFGAHVGTLIGGAVVTETVFAIPGAGRLMIDSIYGRDYPVVQGLVMVLAVAVSVVFLLTDLVQAALDPRVAR